MSGATDGWPSTQWRDAEADDETIRLLGRGLHVSRGVARIMACRGHDDVTLAAEFFTPMLRNLALPDRLPGIARAATIIGAHVAAGNGITVFGDFDADGMTAAVILRTALDAVGAKKTAIFIPDRIKEGYGFTEPALERCLAENPDTKLIVTVDCGISHAPACDRAVAAGIEVVVTDHHEISKETLPKSASVLVNPCLDGTPEPLRHLCGAGVSFKLAHELMRRFLPAQTGRRALQPLLAIAAVGTVGDLVPLVGENRIIASCGLSILNGPGSDELPGLRALRHAAGLRGDIDATALAFLLVPRINAAGRVGNPMVAVNLLSARDMASARPLARRLSEFNQVRRDEESAAVREAEKGIPEGDLPPALVQFNESWHPGVIGLVASRLSNRLHRPTIVFTADEVPGVVRGSARCPEIPGLDLMQLLEKTGGSVKSGGMLLSFGGHRAAAGLTLASENLEAFKAVFSEVCENAENGLDMRPESRIEAWLEPDEADDGLVDEIARLGPFGTLNPAPFLALRGVTLAEDPAKFGRTNVNWHIDLEESRVPAIVFGRTDMPFKKGDRVDIVFHFSRDNYGSPQFFVKDMRRSV